MPKFFIDGRWNGHYPTPLEKNPREVWDPIHGWRKDFKPAERRRYEMLRALYMLTNMKPVPNVVALTKMLLDEDGIKEGSAGYEKKRAALDRRIRNARKKYIR